MAISLLLALFAGSSVDAYFSIHAVDSVTRRGIPLVALSTVNHQRFVTDSHGIALIDEPDLLGNEVYFFVTSHGYEFPADGFGYRGTRLRLVPGGQATVELTRLNIAERLYRVTGSGIYADSIRLGIPAPIDEPLLNAQVLGSDSVQNAVFNGEYLWFWGDTNRPSYPLGNFHTPGARSALPGKPGVDPSLGINLSYWTDDTGFAKPTAKMAGDGPTWISGLSVVKDASGAERLFCGYVKVRPPMSVYKHGLAEWNSDQSTFVHHVEFPEDQPIYPDGHPIYLDIRDSNYVYFPTPFPLARVRATPAALADLSQYEAFTCLEPGSKPAEAKVIRDSSGTPEYAWRKNATPLNQDEQNKLIAAGKLENNHALIGLRDLASGKTVLAHGGSISWNEHRKRWVLIAVQVYGSPSFLGEVWYSEADTPLGPWAYGRKVVTHDDYSFYNPKQHPVFEQDGGRLIYFEGTYTATFSGNKNPTPRYDYNQLMYRLDLDDPRLNLPVAIYRGPGSDSESLRRFGQVDSKAKSLPIAFFALERPGQSTIPLYIRSTGDHGYRLTTETGDKAEIAFHAMPFDSKAELPPGTIPFYEWSETGAKRYAYRVGDQPGPQGWQRGKIPIALVWENPCLSPFPLNPE
jgi:hypothetical protein